ncbi:fucose 4-O-acetylase-like acetyltransferase [Desmospora activa DSM 45169]|uniref:Fucose 4-O-acetylase-like acetyltransferase n=1 Tax=Desmospora activa DSM 45169 TaxID=1121389 RepID=A0A2T4Z1V2_9BACL|nr:fucose 4-O-acetylase-like acetyltransferase [Desmospora activa DSM 45169]
MKGSTESALSPISEKSRLVYLDNIKVALTLLVVAHHAGQAYGPTNDWPILSVERSSILGSFFDVNGAFLMGLFFLISAYFTPASVDRKGIGSFLKGRFLLLGIPFVFMLVVVFGPITYVVDKVDIGFWEYMFFVYIGQGDFEVGHLWFIALLLVFSVCYSIARFVSPLVNVRIKPIISLPGHFSLLIFSIILAFLNFIIRIWFPVGVWVDIFPFMPLEIGRFPQYACFFVIGIIAYRYNWLNTIPTMTGVIWFIIGVMAGIIHYTNTSLNLIPSVIIWPLLEAFIGVGLMTGLLVIGRDFWNKRGRLMTWLADNAFTVYLIHIFMVYLFQVTMEEIAMGPFLKFVIVSITGAILSFVISHFIRKMPLVNKIL